MTRQQVQELIATGESQTIEFKRRFSSPEKIARELCAFANTDGGYLLIGVDDDGKVIGVASEKQEIELIELACSLYIRPPLNAEVWVVSLNGKDVVVVSITPSPLRPHRVVVPGTEQRGTVFIRHCDQSIVASREVVHLLSSQRPDAPPLRLRIGPHERALFRFLEANGRITVSQFARLVRIPPRKASQILVRLTRAGLLQFHLEPTAEYFTLAGEDAR
jgi:Predicted transcriptional regulator containing an HTH domain and an uncharacterized domain shared with the mammalian protein Schlafen